MVHCTVLVNLGTDFLTCTHLYLPNARGMCPCPQVQWWDGFPVQSQLTAATCGLFLTWGCPLLHSSCCKNQHTSLPSSVGWPLSSFNKKEAQVSGMKHFPSSSVRNLLVLERACHFMGKRKRFKNKPSLKCFLIQLCWPWVARQHRFSCDRKINVLNSSNNNKTPKFLKALCLPE